MIAVTAAVPQPRISIPFALILPPCRTKAERLMNSAKPFWEKPLASLDRGEWEALCDGCGRCCLHKLEDEETGELFPTNVACKLLDRRMGQCTDYARRKSLVADCVKLDPARLDELEWLPTTCAYR